MEMDKRVAQMRWHHWEGFLPGKKPPTQLTWKSMSIQSWAFSEDLNKGWVSRDGGKNVLDPRNLTVAYTHSITATTNKFAAAVLAIVKAHTFSPGE